MVLLRGFLKVDMNDMVNWKDYTMDFALVLEVKAFRSDLVSGIGLENRLRVVRMDFH